MNKALRISEVEERIGLKKSAIYKRINEGCFPQGIKVSPKVTIWQSNDIDEWLKERAIETEEFRQKKGGQS